MRHRYDWDLVQSIHLFVFKKCTTVWLSANKMRTSIHSNAYFHSIHIHNSFCGTSMPTGTSKYQRPISTKLVAVETMQKTARQVLVYILDTNRRLLHPYMSFVKEQLRHHLPQAPKVDSVTANTLMLTD